MKRGFDKLLSEGKGKQFFWLLGLVVLVLAIAIVVSLFVYKQLPWQQVVAVLLDPGCYGNSKWEYDWILLPLAVFSLIFLSGLLVSTFTNVVENISVSVRMGHRRYKVENHTLILGAGRQLAPILEALKDSDKNVIVMSEERPTVKGNYIYYCGKRDSEDDLRSARPEYADTIYIIGENDEPDHDSKTIKAIALLEELTQNSSQEKIYCYATLLDRVSSEVYEYSRLKPNGHLLLVDVINDYEYLSQLLMVNTDFLPTIKSGDIRRSHVVIYGNDHIAQNVAYTVAHISHYANFTECGAKTCITIIGEDMRRKLDNLVAARPGLFDLSVYTYIDASGKKEVHTPNSDFLDVEWQFVDTYSTSQLARKIVTDINNADDEILTIVVANENPAEATRTVLHLPREVYNNHIAVYMEHSADVIELSRKSGMYGNIVVFGDAATLSDPLFKNRSIMGQRVNYIYDRAYSKPPSANAEEAWYGLSESNKYSSIYCAIALPMRERCFDMDGDRNAIYEAEHRRWMMSVLIMGWRAGSKRDNSSFTHNDIVPFNELLPEEQRKDKILIDAIPHILGSTV